MFCVASQANPKLFGFRIPIWHVAPVCSEDMAEDESQYDPKLEIRRDAPKENTDLGEDNFSGTLWGSTPLCKPLFVRG